MRVTDVACTWTRTVDPVEEPISLEEAKAQARVTDESSDGVFDGYIQTARQACEDYMGRGLFTQTWRMVLEDFADVIPLPMAAPLQSVSSITYYDVDGVSQTLSTSVYDTDTNSRPGCVVLKVNQSWPELQSGRLNGRVTITYVVGWTATGSIPQLIKHGLLMYVTYLDLDRDGMEAGAQAARRAAELCWADRVTWVPPQRCW